MKKPIITLLFVFCAVLPLSAQLNWTKYSRNPIIKFWSIDSKATETYDPCVLLDNGTYKMWYTRKVAGIEKIGYATSPDGISWTLVDTAVLVPVSKTTTRFDFNKVGQGSIIKDGDTLKMWYWGDGPNIGNIGLAWSLDGRSWTRVDGSKSDLSVYDRTADGSSPLAIATPCVLKVSSTYHMWYTRVGLTGAWSIAYATSPDGLTWTNVAGTGTSSCVIGIGSSGSFDEALVGYPMVLLTASGFEMWYAALDAAQSIRIGYATSINGKDWTRITGSAAKGACFDSAGVCAIIKDGTTYKMWYGPSITEFYYATSSATSGVARNKALPASFQLHQNYPNPFNPSTVIGYQLSAASQVKLSVCDVLGREVAILVNEQKPAGNYTVQWNARDMTSGMYFYTLSSGRISKTMKLVLTK